VFGKAHSISFTQRKPQEATIVTIPGNMIVTDVRLVFILITLTHSFSNA